MTELTTHFSDTTDTSDISQGKKSPSTALDSPAIRVLAIAGILLILFLAGQLGGLAPAPPISVPSVEMVRTDPGVTRPSSPQPTFLQAQDSKLEPSDPSVPAERTTLLPVPDFSR
jgi:hypothetical protein